MRKELVKKVCLFLFVGAVAVFLSGCDIFDFTDDETYLRGELTLTEELIEDRQAFIYLWETDKLMKDDPTSGLEFEWEKEKIIMSYDIAFIYEDGHFKKNTDYYLTAGITSAEIGSEPLDEILLYFGVYGVENPEKLDGEVLILEEGDIKEDLDFELFPYGEFDF